MSMIFFVFVVPKVCVRKWKPLSTTELSACHIGEAFFFSCQRPLLLSLYTSPEKRKGTVVIHSFDELNKFCAKHEVSRNSGFKKD